MAKKDKDASVLFELIANNQGKIKGMDLVQPKKTPEEQTGTPELTPIESDTTEDTPSPEAPALPEEKPLEPAEAPEAVIESPEPVEPAPPEMDEPVEEALDDEPATEPEPAPDPAPEAQPEEPIDDAPLLAHAGLDEPAAETPDPAEIVEPEVVVTEDAEASDTPTEDDAPAPLQLGEPIQTIDSPLPIPTAIPEPEPEAAPLPVAAQEEKEPMDLEWLKSFLASAKRVSLTFLASTKRVSLAVLAAVMTWLRKVPVWLTQLGRSSKGLWSKCQPKLTNACQATIRFVRSKLAIRIGLGVVVALVLLVVGLKLAPNGATPVEQPVENNGNQTPPPPVSDTVQVLLVTRLPYSPQGVRMAEYLADYCLSHGLAASVVPLNERTYAGVIIRTEFEDAALPRAQALLTRVSDLPLQTIMNEEFGDLGESYQLADPMYFPVKKKTD